MRRVFNLQFVRFLLVGGLNTGFSYAVYAALLYLGVGYVAANFTAVLIGIVFSFRTQGRLVFGNRAGHVFFRFAACWGLIWLLNIMFIALLIHSGLNAYWAGAAALVPTTLCSYLIQKFLVFGAAQPAAKSAG